MHKSTPIGPQKEANVFTLGVSKTGGPRLWIERKRLALYGFKKGVRFSPVERSSGVVFKLDAAGTNCVSAKSKRSGAEVPVIDLTSRDVLKMFLGHSHVRVIMKEGEFHVLPLASSIRAAERIKNFKAAMDANEPIQTGALAHGIGILDRALHDGMELGGLKTELAFAVEIDPDLTDHASDVNPIWTSKTMAISMPMQEAAFDPYLMSQLPAIHLLFAGIPCSGASRAGRSKNRIAHPEAHEHVGHLIVPYLAFLVRSNPIAGKLENVPEWLDSASADILRNFARDMGYVIFEEVLNSSDFNTLEARKRASITLVTKGIPYTPRLRVQPPKITRHLSEILESIAPDDPRWSKMEGLKAHCKKHRELGHGFEMQVFGPDDTRIGVLTAGYARVRPTDPKISHPSNPELLRQVTVGEHAAAKDIDPAMVQDICGTEAHRMMGQGVCPPPFEAEGELLAFCLKRWHEGVVIDDNFYNVYIRTNLGITEVPGTIDSTNGRLYLRASRSTPVIAWPCEVEVMVMNEAGDSMQLKLRKDSVADDVFLFDTEQLTASFQPKMPEEVTEDLFSSIKGTSAQSEFKIAA